MKNIDEINDTQNLYYHWVNIVGVITDNIKNCVTLRVQSWGENMKIKKVCIFIVTISAVIIVISMLNKAFYDSYHNPYNSKEEKEELSIMWNQMTLGISDFNLIKFYKTNNEEGLQISIYINQGSAWFTDETIESINQLINQTIDILNNSDNIEKYSKMNIKFSTSKIEGPAGMSCNLLKEGNRFYLDSISDHHGVLLSQLHLFKNVKKIRYEYFPQTFDDDIILPESDMIESISIHVYGDEEFEKVKILEQKETDYKIEVIDDKKNSKMG